MDAMNRKSVAGDLAHAEQNAPIAADQVNHVGTGAQLELVRTLVHDPPTRRDGGRVIPNVWQFDAEHLPVTIREFGEGGFRYAMPKPRVGGVARCMVGVMAKVLVAERRILDSEQYELVPYLVHAQRVHLPGLGPVDVVQHQIPLNLGEERTTLLGRVDDVILQQLLDEVGSLEVQRVENGGALIDNFLRRGHDRRLAAYTLRVWQVHRQLLIQGPLQVDWHVQLDVQGSTEASIGDWRSMRRRPCWLSIRSPGLAVAIPVVVATARAATSASARTQIMMAPNGAKVSGISSTCRMSDCRISKLLPRSARLG